MVGVEVGGVPVKVLVIVGREDEDAVGVIVPVLVIVGVNVDEGRIVDVAPSKGFSVQVGPNFEVEVKDGVASSGYNVPEGAKVNNKSEVSIELYGGGNGLNGT